jgi:8-oxo-dGTP pyrophosphatase MutT (NUDIX family)
MRHVRTCNNAVLPGERTAFHVDEYPVGWLLPALAAALRGFPDLRSEPDRLTLTAPHALPAIARELAARGFYRWRGEAFDVRAPDGTVLTTIDRGALPSFGVAADGVHVNGLVRRGAGLHLWVARRAMTKTLDPGKLDHLVAGGVPAGLTPAETLVKEAAEEAAIPAPLAWAAKSRSVICYTMERCEGLRRDRLHCYDLELPESFMPRAADGEVEAFELWPIGRAMDAVRTTDAFKFNVTLVLIDLFLREGLIVGGEAEELRRALDAGHL